MRRHTGTAGGLRRPTLTAALLAVAVAVAGCDGSWSTGSTASAPPSPKEALLASVPEGAEGPFRFSGKDRSPDLSSTIDLSGSVDPAAKGLQISTSTKDAELGFTMTMTFLVIAEQPWVKISFTNTKGVRGLPKLPAKWLRLDPNKITKTENVPTYDGADVGNAGPLLEAATAVQDQGGGRYAGTIDLTSGEAAKVLEAEQMTALGDAAKQVPFTATVGPDQHLASLILDVPAVGSAKAYTYVVTYADYGKAPKLAAPAAGSAQNAPPLVYEMING